MFFQQAICHDDTALSNITGAAAASVNNVGFFDMQCVAAEHSMRDIAYHLISACPDDLLATPGVEEDLIRHYLHKLELAVGRYTVTDSDSNNNSDNDNPVESSNGYSTVYTYEEGYFLYRSHALWCLYAFVMSAGASDLFDSEAAIGIIQRIVNSCTRLDILGALEDILDDRTPLSWMQC